MGADAFHLISIAAQARFVGDLFKLGEIVGEPTFLVGGPRKNWGVGRRAAAGGATPARVRRRTKPLASLARLITARNAGAQFPASLLQREIFLMVPHYRDQDFVRQVQERGNRTCPG